MSSELTHRVVVKNPEGLHLRPADQLVRMAGDFESVILIGKLKGPMSSSGDGPLGPDESGIAAVLPGEMLDCKSILSLLTLGAAEGDILTLAISGSDAPQALDKIRRWFDSGFADDFEH